MWEKSGVERSVSANGVTVFPLLSCCEKPAPVGVTPFAPGNSPNRLSKLRLCIMTTMMFLIVADEGVGLGLGGGGVGEGPGAVLRIPAPQSTNTNSKPSNTVLRIAHIK